MRIHQGYTITLHLKFKDGVPSHRKTIKQIFGEVNDTRIDELRIKRVDEVVTIIAGNGGSSE